MNKTESENSILLIADGCKKKRAAQHTTKQNDHIELFVSDDRVCVITSVSMFGSIIRCDVIIC